MESVTGTAISGSANLPIVPDVDEQPSVLSAEGLRSDPDPGAPSSALDSSGDASSSEDVPESASSESKPEIPIPSCIQFHKKGEAESQLTVTIKPSDEFPVGIASKSIQSWIRQQGCESWMQNEEAISRFSREARRLEKPKEYVLAERKDCRVELQVARDRLNAWVHISPAQGGEPFSENLLMNAMEANHIQFGIKEDVLREIIKDGQCEKRLIAEGAPPTEGTKVRFEPLVVESDHKGVPQEREDGRVDYKDLGLFLSVSKGTPLLRHIPPTPGIPGKGVDGEPIPAPPARDRSPHPGTGTALSKDDPDVVIAIRGGQPCYFENSVRVDPTLELDKVDPSTGNVIFDGNIIVRGPVEAGFTVHAGQDLTILDTIEGANLTSGKNMLLVTGVYGRSRSEIRVKGNLEARFLSDCTIHCGGNIEVRDLLSHCIVDCEGALYLGKLGGKGQIIGGNIRALREIQAQIIGSVSEITTRCEVGIADGLLLRADKLKGEIDVTQHDLKEVGKKLQSLWNQEVGTDDPRFKSLSEKETVLTDILDALQSEEKDIQNKLAASRNGKIRAEQVYRGAELRVGSVRQSVSDLTTDFYLFQPHEDELQSA